MVPRLICRHQLLCRLDQRGRARRNPDRAELKSPRGRDRQICRALAGFDQERFSLKVEHSAFELLTQRDLDAE